MGTFVNFERDDFSPEYGEINWKRRLNARLEAAEIELETVGYREGDKPVMQVTQENTHVYVNQTADEMDCIAIQYDQDEGGIYTWYFRELIEKDGELTFERIAQSIGNWAMVVTTLYPLEHIVLQYERLSTRDMGDTIPSDWV